MHTSVRPSTSRRLRVVLAGLLVLVPLGGAACSSDGGGSSKETGPEAEAGTGQADVDAPSGGAADDGTVAQADVPEDGVPFADALSRSDEFEDPTELQKALSVIGTDKPGYVSGTTIVAQPAAGTDRQFVCISVGVLDLQTYRLVVVDEAGAPLDC